MNVGHDILERFHVVTEIGDFEAANELAALIANGLEPSQSGKPTHLWRNGGDTEGACKIEGCQSSVVSCFACEEEIGCADCCCCAVLKSKPVRFAESTDD